MQKLKILRELLQLKSFLTRLGVDFLQQNGKSINCRSFNKGIVPGKVDGRK